MLLNDTMLLRVSVPRASRATAYCSFDGKGRIELRQGDHVTIAASQYPFPTVLAHPTEWFDSISRTLRWNTRAAKQKAWGKAAGGGAKKRRSPEADGENLDGDKDDEEDDDDDDAEEEWDIDTTEDTMDSGVYSQTGSEEGSISASPLKRQMSLLLP